MVSVQVVAEERRQGAMSRDLFVPSEPNKLPQSTRAKARAKTAQTVQQQRQQQTLGEKQAERVEALRSAQSSEAEMASSRARIAADITIQLDVRVRGKSLRQALEEFGVPVARDMPESDAIASAYKKALAKFHPDRAMQKRLSLNAQVEAEETYKLLQNLHEVWTKRAAQRPDINNPFAATAASRRDTTDTPSWSSAAGHAYGAGRRTGTGARPGGRPRSAGTNANNANGYGKWSTKGQQQQQVCVCLVDTNTAALAIMVAHFFGAKC